MIHQYKVRVDVYSCNVHVVVTDDMNAYIRELEKQYDTVEGVDGSEGFMFTPDMKTYYVVFDDVFLTHNTIAHEVFHLTCSICNDRDVIEEEPKAWLSGFLTENIYKFIDKKNLVLKKDA